MIVKCQICGKEYEAKPIHVESGYARYAGKIFIYIHHNQVDSVLKIVLGLGCLVVIVIYGKVV